MKRICSKCGKIINREIKCECYKSIKRVKPTQTVDKGEDLIFKHKYKWWKLREEIIKRDNGHCQRCWNKYGILNDQRLEVHHIKPRTKYPELTFEEENLVTLCRTCNAQLGVREELDFAWEVPCDEDRIILL